MKRRYLPLILLVICGSPALAETVALDSLIGLPLRIRMTFSYATNDPAGFPTSQQAQFDKVRLTAGTGTGG